MTARTKCIRSKKIIKKKRERKGKKGKKNSSHSLNSIAHFFLLHLDLDVSSSSSSSSSFIAGISWYLLERGKEPKYCPLQSSFPSASDSLLLLLLLLLLLEFPFNSFLQLISLFSSPLLSYTH